jgi:hypothetical protein
VMNREGGYKPVEDECVSQLLRAEDDACSPPDNFRTFTLSKEIPSVTVHELRQLAADQRGIASRPDLPKVALSC